ncbi:hypothetical protein [Pseudotabrizicola alkalilacus]|uniref:hypothetical protein n=1 Tax=Pseudotabrizicola alkalilacus TaxID=2305252 RepID=UPI0013144AF1|nr:hypothetical protein [Pseudotabrizicola alkalilacus]
MKEAYDLTRAITHAAREFAPDLFVIFGSGTTQGRAVAQSLILAEWCGLKSEADFQTSQTAAPSLSRWAWKSNGALSPRETATIPGTSALSSRTAGSLVVQFCLPFRLAQGRCLERRNRRACGR